MIGLFIRWAVNTIALLIVVSLLPGITVDRWETVIVAALVLGFLNSFLRPFIVLLTLPFQVMSLGIFTLFVNAIMFYFVSKIVTGFYLATFWSAFWGALLFSFISFLLNIIIDPAGRISVTFRERSHFYKNFESTVIDVEGKTKNDDDQKRSLGH